VYKKGRRREAPNPGSCERRDKVSHQRPDDEAMSQAAQKIADPQVRARAAESLGVSEAFLTHALTPQNVGVLPRADGQAAPKGSCGDSIELYLQVSDGRVQDARFMTDGCAHTVACGSALTGLIKGRELEEAAGVSAQEIEEELGGLPREHKHCAALAALALRGALRDFYKKRREPWRKLYGGQEDQP
jgi:NifU-like protein involved in Fe-S cluster formation